MSDTTPFPGGITTAKPGTTLESFVVPDQTKIHMIFDDFYFFNTDQTTPGLNDTKWGVYDGIPGTPGTFTPFDGEGGILRLTSGAIADGTLALMAPKNGFTFERGHETWFKAIYIWTSRSTRSSWPPRTIPMRWRP